MPPIGPTGPIDPSEFVAAVQPLLAGCDAQGLIDLLKSRWTDGQIASLFRSGDGDVRKVAALAFGLVGKKCLLPKLVPLLKDKDQLARALAEKLLSYATGASPGKSDQPEIEAVVAKIRSKDYGLRTLIHEIVQSKVFQSK